MCKSFVPKVGEFMGGGGLGTGIDCVICSGGGNGSSSSSGGGGGRSSIA